MSLNMLVAQIEQEIQSIYKQHPQTRKKTLKALRESKNVTNIQKLILARVFEQQPEIILANQPTRGLDMGAASDVQKRLIEARDRGGGVILISEDLDEILGLADRIVVIRDGNLHDVSSSNREDIGLMMAGEAT